MCTHLCKAVAQPFAARLGAPSRVRVRVRVRVRRILNVSGLGLASESD